MRCCLGAKSHVWVSDPAPLRAAQLEDTMPGNSLGKYLQTNTKQQTLILVPSSCSDLE